jgi:hypothetical protein
VNVGPLETQVVPGRWGIWSLGVGCVALLICALGGWLVDPAQFFRAYFAAYIFWLGIGLGGMAVVMLYHLTGGAWGFVIRRILEAQMNTVPLLALLFVPIGFGVRHLYLWAQPAVVAADSKLQEQQFYLNPQFFLWRSAGYLALWIVFALLVNRHSKRQDRTGDARLPWKLQRISEVGLVLYGTSLHFAAFDWIETLHPKFHSTIFPLLVAAGQVLSAQAFALLVLARVGQRTSVREFLSTRALNDLGNVLLTFLILWAYMVWFQFMLIWIGNQPSGVLWYAPRMRGVWQWLTWVLFIGQFAVPLFLLLFRSMKCNPTSLASIAGLVLVMQLLFNYYQVLPAFDARRFASHWMDFLTPIGIGGIWLSYFCWQLQRRPIVVLHDPSRESALHLLHIDEEEALREEALAHG